MKRNFGIGVIGLVVLGSVLGAQSVRADQIQVPERVFVPVGFDNNDNAQVVLYGHFPDNCYQAGPAKAFIRGKEILIRNISLRSDSGACLKAPVPWSTTVNLGAVPTGLYSVLVEGPEGKMSYFRDLEIFPSMTDRPDDFLYAYVNGAIVDRTSRLPVLTISGSFNITCMEIADIRVKETANVIVVLPIVRLRTDVPCGYPFAPIPFTKHIQLHPKTEQATLVHIRSVNGQAVNQIIDY